MSEARQHRFEIDIDEIERQLRRSVDASPAPRPDPLAELARIVGQDDPFRGILGGSPPGAKAQTSGLAPAAEPRLTAEERAVLGSHDPRRDVYDPAAGGYDDLDPGYDQDDVSPLEPRRSRRRLAAVLTGLIVAVVGAGGFLAWRHAGSSGFTASRGTPPVIVADRTPLRVPPENPGGMEVPNQERQIYERGATDGQSRIVDSREQPVDVREAVRGLPSQPATADNARPNGGASRSNAVTSALGEPRRVRTVAVRPDGTTYTPTTTASTGLDSQASLLPGRSFPAPVPVSTVSVPANGGGSSLPATSSAPQAEPAATTASPGGPIVSVLPPQRPRVETRVAAASPPATSDSPATPRAAAAPDPRSVAAARGGYSVQLAVRGSEEEARTTFAQLQSRYASELNGKSALIRKAEVNGKEVYRVRVGPLSKDDANSLCTRLKSSGGQCFPIAGN